MIDSVKKNLVLILFVIILFSISLTVVEARVIKLYTEDSVSLEGLPITIKISNNNDSYYFDSLVDYNNSIYVDGTRGYLTAIIHVNNTFYTGHFVLESNDNYMILRKTARISGFVTDEKDNMLPHVKLRIFCSSLIQSDLPQETDNLGFFSIDKIGFGSCDINIIKDNKIVTYHQIINESKDYIIHIQINTHDEKRSLIPLFLLVLFILVLILLLFFIKSARSNKKKLINNSSSGKTAKSLRSSEKTASQKDFSERQKDIMKTLSEKEKNIITFLFFEGKLTQSQLRHKTGFPKSTLHRTLKKLENKNIIICKEYAGIKKFELTEFFLG